MMGDDHELLFNALMLKFGVMDYVIWTPAFDYVRVRSYNDGAWLEGYRMDPVMYFGA